MVKAEDPNADMAPESTQLPQSVSSSAELPLVVVDRSRQQADKPPSSRSTTPRSFRLIGLVFVIVLSIVAGGIIGLYRQPPGLQWVMNTLGLTPGGGTSTPIVVPVARLPSSQAASTQATGIVALGRLIPAGEVVTVAPSSGVRDARIAELKVAEGDTVKRGQILAILDSEPRLASAVTSARTLVAVREATVLQTRASVRASLVEAQASLSRAEAAALRARQDFERTERLFKRNIVAKATYDQQVATLREAEKEVERQKATVSRYESQDLSNQPDVIVATRNVEAAKADLKRAVEDLEQAYVRAPIAGTVLEINARTGEKPGDSGVLELGNVAKMMAEVEVYQSQIGKVAVGDPVTLSAAALPETLSGIVTRIGLKVKRQSAIGQDPAANTDARIVEVIVALNKASSQIASRFTDLQVEARIETGNRP